MNDRLGARLAAFGDGDDFPDLDEEPEVGPMAAPSNGGVPPVAGPAAVTTPPPVAAPEPPVYPPAAPPPPAGLVPDRYAEERRLAEQTAAATGVGWGESTPGQQWEQSVSQRLDAVLEGQQRMQGLIADLYAKLGVNMPAEPDPVMVEEAKAILGLRQVRQLDGDQVAKAHMVLSMMETAFQGADPDAIKLAVRAAAVGGDSSVVNA